MNEIFRSRPGNYIAALEELGFKYHEEKDDEEMKKGQLNRTIRVNGN